MRMIVKARRNTARYAAGVFRIVHINWYGIREDVSTEITYRGKRKRRRFYLLQGSVSKDVISKFAFERDLYEYYADRNHA